MIDPVNEYVWVVLNPDNGIEILSVYTSAEGAHAAARQAQELLEPEEGDEIRTICCRLIDTATAINEMNDHLNHLRHLKITKSAVELQQQQQLLDEEKPIADGSPCSIEEQDEEEQ